jgi:predicted transcriptional regulator
MGAKARAVIGYLGVRKIGLTSVSIAAELGISPSAVSRAIARAPEILQREEIKEEWLEYQ